MHDRYLYYRIFGNAAFAFAQITHFLEMQNKLHTYLPTHPELKEFASLRSRYLTLWTLFIQIFYSFVALLCDVTTAFKMNVVPDWFRNKRFMLAHAVLLPLGLATSTFWPYYLYDRNLMMPEYLDKVISPACNILWHCNVLYALWEITFLPKDAPRTSDSLKLLVLANILYISSLLYTRYGDLGIWAYPTLALAEGTIFLYISIGFVAILSISAYFLQFKLIDLIWKSRETKKE